MPISTSGAISIARSTQRITASSGTRPSHGQSKQVERPSRSFGLAAPSPFQAAAKSRKLSSTLRLTLDWLWLSDTEITQLISLTPAESARSRPRALGTSAITRMDFGSRARFRISGVSAICGMALGLTNEPISSRVKPQAASASISAILVSVGMKALTAWKPSRGATSTISTDGMGTSWGLWGQTLRV